MYRRLAILFVLQLILGASRECISAEQSAPAARGESDSVEVVRNEQELALERSDRRFLPFAGKRVGRIRIKILAVFGASVDGTARVTESRLLRSLNKLNFRTRETTIRRNLLFKEGDAIDPLRLADSERILRSLAFIGDARIIVVQDRGSGDSADLLVIVKESWTLTLSGSLKEGNRLKVSLAERNVLGLGHQVSGAVMLIPDVSPRFATSYSVQNIRGSFITGELEYANISGQRTAGFALSRELVSPVLEYAGGLDLRRTLIAVEDSFPSMADNASNPIDLWVGRRFHLGLRQRDIDRSRILFVSGRIRHLNFTKRPPVTPSTFN